MITSDDLSEEDIAWITNSKRFRGDVRKINDFQVVYTEIKGILLVTFDPSDDKENIDWFLENILMEDATSLLNICVKERFESDYKRTYFTSAYEKGRYEEWKKAVMIQLGGRETEKDLADLFGLEHSFINLFDSELDSDKHEETRKHLESQSEQLPQLKFQINQYLIKTTLSWIMITGKMKRYRNYILSGRYGKFCYVYRYDENSGELMTLREPNRFGKNPIPYHTFYALFRTSNKDVSLPEHNHEDYEPFKYIRWRIDSKYTAYGRLDPMEIKSSGKKYIMTCIFSIDPNNASMDPPLPMILPDYSVQNPTDPNPNFRIIRTSEYEQKLQQYVDIVNNPKNTGVYHGFKGFEYFRGVPDKRGITSAFDDNKTYSSIKIGFELGGETLSNASVSEIPNKIPSSSTKLKLGDLVKDSHGVWVLVSNVTLTSAKGLNVDPASGEGLFMNETRNISLDLVDSQDQQLLSAKLNRWAEQENRWFSIDGNANQKKYGILRYVTSEVELVIGVRKINNLHDVERISLRLEDFLLSQKKANLELNQIKEISDRIIKGLEAKTFYTYQRFINGGLRYQGHLYSDEDGVDADFITSNNRFITSADVESEDFSSDENEEFNIMSYSLQKESDPKSFLIALEKKIKSLPFITASASRELNFVTSTAKEGVITSKDPPLAALYEDILFPPFALVFPDEEQEETSEKKVIYDYIKDTFSKPFLNLVPQRSILQYFLQLEDDDPIKLQLAESFNGVVVKLPSSSDKNTKERRDILTVIDEQSKLGFQTSGNEFNSMKQISSIEPRIPGVAIYNSKKLYRYDIPTSIRDFEQKDFDNTALSFPHILYQFKKGDSVVVVENGDFFDRRRFTYTTVSGVVSLKNNLPALRLQISDADNSYVDARSLILNKNGTKKSSTSDPNKNFVYQTLSSTSEKADILKYSLTKLAKHRTINSVFEWKIFNGFVDSLSAYILPEIQSPSSSSTVVSTLPGVKIGTVITKRDDLLEYIVLKLVFENRFLVRRISSNDMVTGGDYEYLSRKQFNVASTQGLQNTNVKNILSRFVEDFQFMSYDKNLYYHLVRNDRNFKDSLYVSIEKSYNYSNKQVMFHSPMKKVLFAEFLIIGDIKYQFEGEWGFIAHTFGENDFTNGVEWGRDDKHLDTVFTNRIKQSSNTLLRSIFFPSETLVVLYDELAVQAFIKHETGAPIIVGVKGVNLLSQLEQRKLKLRETKEMSIVGKWFLWDDNEGSMYINYHSKENGTSYRKFEKTSSTNGKWMPITLLEKNNRNSISEQVDTTMIQTNSLLNLAIKEAIEDVNSLNLSPVVGKYIIDDNDTVFGNFKKLRWDESENEVYVTLRNQLFAAGDNMVYQWLTSSKLFPKDFSMETEYSVDNNTAIYYSDFSGLVHSSAASFDNRIGDLRSMAETINPLTNIYLMEYFLNSKTIQTDLLLDINITTLIPERRLIHLKDRNGYTVTMMEMNSNRTIFEISRSLGDERVVELGALIIPYTSAINNKREHWLETYYGPEGNILQYIFPLRIDSENRDTIMVPSKFKIDPKDFSKSSVSGYEVLKKFDQKVIPLYFPGQRNGKNALEFNITKHNAAKSFLKEQIEDNKDLVESYTRYNVRQEVILPPRDKIFRRYKNELYSLSNDRTRMEILKLTPIDTNLFIAPLIPGLFTTRYQGIQVVDSRNDNILITTEGARRTGVFYSTERGEPDIPFEFAKVLTDVLSLLKMRYNETLENWDWDFPYAYLEYPDGSQLIITFTEIQSDIIVGSFPTSLFDIKTNTARVKLVYEKKSGSDEAWKWKSFEEVSSQRINRTIQIGKNNSKLTNKMYEALEDVFKLKDPDLLSRPVIIDGFSDNFLSYKKLKRPDFIKMILIAGAEETEENLGKIDDIDIYDIEDIYFLAEDDKETIRRFIPEEVLKPQPQPQPLPIPSPKGVEGGINAVSLVTELKTYLPEYQIERFPKIGDPAGTMNNAIFTLTFSSTTNSAFRSSFIGTKLSSQHMLYEKSHLSREYFIIWRSPNGQFTGNQPHFSKVTHSHPNFIPANGTVKISIQVRSMRYEIISTYDTLRKIHQPNVVSETLLSISLFPFIKNRMQARIVLKPLTKSTLQLHYARFDVFYPFLLK